MPYAKLNERFLEAKGILAGLEDIQSALLKLQKTNPQLDLREIFLRKIMALQDVLRSIFFDGMDDAAVQALLSSHVTPFLSDYPLLGEALSIIFSKKSLDDFGLTIDHLRREIDSGAKKDWYPTQARLDNEYEALNRLHGYFPPGLKNEPAMQGLFRELVVACRKVCVLIEKNNTPDDGMAYHYAYKLMALLIDVGQIPPSLQSLSQQIDKMLTPIKSEERPFHNCLLDLRLPRADAFEDKEGWLSFVKRFDVRALRFFSSATKIEQMSGGRAPTTLEKAAAALAKATYKRHSEDPEWTQLCHQYKVPEPTFNAGLDCMGRQPGWPKKVTDSIPEIDIEHQGYIWTKLSALDKRGLILGKITNCCQSIGDHSSQCVEDAMSLDKNALYVLLKSLKKDRANYKKSDGSINDDDYQIIGQSYVWKSKNGNLCLDSVECLAGRAMPAVMPEGQKERQKIEGLADLRKILHLFGKQVLAVDTSIKRVTLGAGGNTPRGLFDVVRIPEAIAQGEFYGDAREQYIIARNNQLTEEEEQALSDLCAGYEGVREPGEFYECMSYLSEQLSDSKDFTTRLSALIKKHPNFPHVFTREALHRLLHFTSAPSLDDLVPIDFTTLASMHRGGIASRGHLMWQANTSEKIINALFCMSQEDRLFSVKEDLDGHTVLHLVAENPESLEFVLLLYPKEQRLAAVNKKNSNLKTVLQLATSNPKSFKVILSHLPDEARLAVQSDVDVFYCALFQPESLKLLLSTYSQDVALATVREMDGGYTSALYSVAAKPESLEMILALYPEKERLAAVIKKSYDGRSVLRSAAMHPASLQVILSHLPEEARLAVLFEVFDYALFQPESLKFLLSIYSQDEALAAVKRIGGSLTNALYRVVRNAELFKIILSLYPEKERLAAVSKTSYEGRSVLHYATKHPESFELLLSLLTEEIALLLKTRREEISTESNEVLECAFSIEAFMKAMEGLSEDQSIKDFVRAIITNQGIEAAQQSLLHIGSSPTFFPQDKAIAILEHMEKLHPYWKTRIEISTHKHGLP